MEALSKFSAFFVHDLKNIASKLSMVLQNFPEHYDNPDFRKDALALFGQSVGKINILTRRMSELREPPMIKAEPGDLKNIARSSISEIDPPKGVSITEDYAEVSTSRFDKEQISKVITNLVINAIEAVGEAGKVDVRTFHKNGWIVLEVSDDGPGIKEDFMANSLFHPFKTTKPNGLGIGLFQSRTIVEAHGGRILVSSRPGEGSTFQLFLPETGETGNR